MILVILAACGRGGPEPSAPDAASSPARSPIAHEPGDVETLDVPHELSAIVEPWFGDLPEMAERRLVRAAVARVKRSHGGSCDGDGGSARSQAPTHAADDPFGESADTVDRKAIYEVPEGACAQAHIFGPSGRSTVGEQRGEGGLPMVDQGAGREAGLYVEVGGMSAIMLLMGPP